MLIIYALYFVNLFILKNREYIQPVKVTLNVALFAVPSIINVTYSSCI